MWDSNTKQYRSYPIPTAGGPVNPGKLIIDGDNCYYPWDQSKDGATIQFRVVNHFINNDTIEYRQEFSRDGKQWTLCASGIEHRLKRQTRVVR
jgi:hypothetical protein